MRFVVAALLLVLCFASSSGGAADSAVSAPLAGAAEQKRLDYSGIWEGRCLFSKVEAHVQQKGDRIKGVALVHTFTGDVNPYHFKGRIRDGQVEASHFRGHTFRGSFVSPDEVRGSITTAEKGHVFKLNAQKVSDTPRKR